MEIISDASRNMQWFPNSSVCVRISLKISLFELSLQVILNKLVWKEAHGSAILTAFLGLCH